MRFYGNQLFYGFGGPHPSNLGMYAQFKWFDGRLGCTIVLGVPWSMGLVR